MKITSKWQNARAFSWSEGKMTRKGFGSHIFPELWSNNVGRVIVTFQFVFKIYFKGGFECSSFSSKILAADSENDDTVALV